MVGGVSIIQLLFILLIVVGFFWVAWRLLKMFIRAVTRVAVQEKQKQIDRSDE